MFVIKLKNFLGMDNFKIHQLFSTPVYTTFIDNKIADFVENLITPRINQLKKEGYVSTDHYEKEKIVKADEISQLTKEIKKHLIKFSDETGLYLGNKVDHWVQDYKIGENHPKHAHPESSISGVYFIRANEHAGELQFLTPNPHSYFASYLNEEKKNKDLYYDIKPQKGLLVLFPSYFFHQALHSENKNVIRTSLAFNVSLN